LDSLECSLENLPQTAGSNFDVILSNAVLEHVFDPLQAAKSLFALSATAGVGIHQVDFRDHRDFGRPLEYLLMDEFSFVTMFHERHGECGNRVRPHQLAAMLDEAGFSTVEFRANMWVEETYLTTFFPRLRGAVSSPYSAFDIESLRVVSGQFLLRR
jgi:2-polyprenyl-3-methyl-5-hydroxy-6-metoxy-1,4-benzoquinol methylase